MFRNIEQFLTSFRLIEENAAVVDQLLSLVRHVPVAGKQIHDANIVATMLAHRVPRLLTHNVADFARFSDRIVIVPLV